MDCVCAGKARNGETINLVMPTDMLAKAFYNTVRLVDSMTEIGQWKDEF